MTGPRLKTDRSPAPARAGRMPSVERRDGGAAGQAAFGNLSLQHALRSAGAGASVEVSRADDPHERAAARAADEMAGGHGKTGAGCGTCACTACRAHVHGPHAHVTGTAAGVAHAPAPFRVPGPGRALPERVRAPFERFLGADLTHVRVHDDGAAHAAAEALSANAFTHRSDVYFASGRFDPDTRPGRRLLAHELFHVVDRRAPDAMIHRDPAPAPAPAGPDAVKIGVASIVAGMLTGDVGAIVRPLRRQSVENLKAMRAAAHDQVRIYIERWLVTRQQAADRKRQWSMLGAAAGLVSGAGVLGAAAALKLSQSDGSVQEGLTLILPALPLIDRLELHDEADREIEQAQLDAIRASSTAERKEALNETARIAVVLSRMDAKEEYDARILLDPSTRYDATLKLIKRSDTHWDDEDPVFSAIFDLPIAQRRDLWANEKAKSDLRAFLSDSQMERIQSLCTGTEAQAVIARLRLATVDRRDSKEGIREAVKRAAELLQEESVLRESLASSELSATDKQKVSDRLKELEGLKDLLTFKRDGNDLDEGTFLGMLAASADSPDELGELSRLLMPGVAGAEEQRKFAFQAAKQRILMASGRFSVEEDAVRHALVEARAPLPADAAKLPVEDRARRQREENNKLRAELLADADVQRVIREVSTSGPGARGRAQSLMRLAELTDYDELLYEFSTAINWGQWGQVFKLALVFSKHPSYVADLRKNANRAIGALDAYARIPFKQKAIVDKIFETQKIPVEAVLEVTGNVDILRVTLEQIDEATRAQLRLGYYLDRNPAARDATSDPHKQALAAYQSFEAKLRKSQSTAVSFDDSGFEAVLDATLGSDPPASELKTPEGLYQAASIMHARLGERLALGRGASAYFTETDETMVAAGQQFEALWLQYQQKEGKDKGRLTVVEFAKLATLFDRFEGRAKEFTAASQTASEVAGMIAATAAGVLIVAASGGTATPLVLAAAAAGGAVARVGARELFGEAYYTAMSEEGARDLFLGAVDGALAVLGSSLAARGVELVGLGGKALVSTAAKAAGEAAEQAAARPLMKKVAAGAVEAAIDGAFSSAVSEAVGAMTDARTWSRGIWQGILTIGQTAIVAGLTGLATGGVVGAAVPVLGAGLRGLSKAVFATELEKILDKAGASETLAAARRAAQSGDVEETRRLVGLMEKHLSREEADVLWRELAQGFEGKALAEVTAGATEHRLVACGNTGGLCMCSPKPCAPLKNVLDGLRSHLADKAKTEPKVQAALKKAEDAMAAAEAAIPKKPPRVPPPAQIRDVVNALDVVAKLGDVDDVVLRSLTESINKKRFGEVLKLEGKTLDEIRKDPTLKDMFDKGYQESPSLQRRPGKLEEYPRLTLDPDTRTVHIVGDIVLPPRVPVSPGALSSAAALEAHLIEKSAAFKQYRAALDAHVKGKPGSARAKAIAEELEALRREAADAARGGGTVFVDELRHSFHERTRQMVLDWMFIGNDAKKAYAKFILFTKDLNPAYLGSFGENFYIRLRELEGTTLIRQPRLKEDAAEINRRPDIGQAGDEVFGTTSGQLGDIKATAVGLEQRSVEQIEQMLGAVHQKGGATAAFGAGAKTQSAQFTSFRLVFLNPDGAAGSINVLNRWMRDYPNLVLEIFDKDGVSHLINAAEWKKMGAARFSERVKGFT